MAKYFVEVVEVKYSKVTRRTAFKSLPAAKKGFMASLGNVVRFGMSDNLFVRLVDENGNDAE